MRRRWCRQGDQWGASDLFSGCRCIPNKIRLACLNEASGGERYACHTPQRDESCAPLVGVVPFLGVTNKVAGGLSANCQWCAAENCLKDPPSSLASILLVALVSIELLLEVGLGILDAHPCAQRSLECLTANRTDSDRWSASEILTTRRARFAMRKVSHKVKVLTIPLDLEPPLVNQWQYRAPLLFGGLASV
jgi:hypothetical protein